MRSDSTLADDLARFKANGENIAQAKYFNNVIREPLFKISLAQARKPSDYSFILLCLLTRYALQDPIITLGIFFRLFTLFENACHKLDVKGAIQDADGRSTYNEYMASRRRNDELEEKIHKDESITRNNTAK